jgi:uncharacterized protein YbjT (DUF2867 family)
MKRDELTILVTGATGQQGGAAARHLLRDGWKLRALVRDPSKPAAVALEKAGVELCEGDLRDPGSLYHALDGCHGAYLVTTPRDEGPDGEVREGSNFVEAASHAGVEHLVFSSVIGADLENGASYQWPKHRIEKRISDLGVPATVWRPVTFMENFLYQKEEIVAGHLRAPVAPDVVRQFIAVDDIGMFVALAFREHGHYLGVVREIASDEMTMPEVADLFSLVLDLPIVYDETEPPAGTAPVRNPAPGEAAPRRADLDALRDLTGGLTTLEDWIRAQDWGV